MRSRRREATVAVLEGKACFTTHVINKHVPVFEALDYFRVVTASLEHIRHNRGIQIHGYVIMPDHLHLLTNVPSPEELQVALGAFRRFTAGRILDMLVQDRKTWAVKELQPRPSDPSNVTVWRAGFLPKDASAEQIFDQKLDYIHQNPVRRGYVGAPEHWRFSSARNYYLKEHSELRIGIL